MKLFFSKYQGTGNDFLLIDNRDNKLSLSKEDISYLCNRHFGVGADGLILLEQSDSADFTMKYYNPDGSTGMMCGNGARCIVAFAKDLGLFDKETCFIASDGLHSAKIVEGEKGKYIIKLSISDVKEVREYEDGLYLNTGTAHFIKYCNDVDLIDINQQGREIRYDKRFNFSNGTNANFVQLVDDSELKIRTYERGVEGETLACGTGISAAALSYFYLLNLERGNNFLYLGSRKLERRNKILEQGFISVISKGGNLNVYFQYEEGVFKDVFLEAGVESVFQGEIEL